MNSLLICNHIDFLDVAETWLTSEIGNSFFNISGYEIVQHDFLTETRKHGVCVYIRDSCKYQVIYCSI